MSILKHSNKTAFFYENWCVGTGSTLGAALANAFLVYHKKNWMKVVGLNIDHFTTERL